MTQRGYSASDLMKFLDFIGQKNLMKRNTVDSWRTASQKVLEALDQADKEDLRELDIEQALLRFENRAAGIYKPDSLRVYRSRFSAALGHFLKWSAEPSAFKMSIRARAGKSKTLLSSGRKPSPIKKPSRGVTETESLREDVVSRSEAAQTPDSLVLPIPLRPGVQVKIFGLPTDLTQGEARKISAVISAYASNGDAD